MADVRVQGACCDGWVQRGEGLSRVGGTGMFCDFVVDFLCPDDSRSGDEEYLKERGTSILKGKNGKSQSTRC